MPQTGSASARPPPTREPLITLGRSRAASEHDPVSSRRLFRASSAAAGRGFRSASWSTVSVALRRRLMRGRPPTWDSRRTRRRTTATTSRSPWSTPSRPSRRRSARFAPWTPRWRSLHRPPRCRRRCCRPCLDGYRPARDAASPPRP